jgi:hypothetical protein
LVAGVQGALPTFDTAVKNLSSAINPQQNPAQNLCVGADHGKAVLIMPISVPYTCLQPCLLSLWVKSST